MSTYRELTYMILDEVKGDSDDFLFNENHIVFLLDKYRGFLLKQRYSDIKKQIPYSNYQTLCIDLIEVPAIPGLQCCGATYLRSADKIPFLMQIGNPRIYPTDYYQGEISYISRDRMRYVGYNKYLKNIIYCSLGPDNYLYFTSSNPQFLSLEKVKFTGIFQNSIDAFNNKCKDNNESCDILDEEFPLEEALVPPIIELVIKELTGVIYRPEDEKNNADDDIANTPTK